jgi:hypothetical protein
MINLVQLDQLGEILGNVQVPAGTYTGAALTIAGNPGDVALTVSADPEAGFAGTPGASIPSNQIQIKGVQGSTGSLTMALSRRPTRPASLHAELPYARGRLHDHAELHFRQHAEREGRERKPDLGLQVVELRVSDTCRHRYYRYLRLRFRDRRLGELRGHGANPAGLGCELRDLE